ncbi:15343_t:CDS:1 [Dentiscutata heterogama]|uniref:15343_t:CDS:1 n=1 Tax=Dentiscutata heterogama TaxID=1316150 RepID=A0ACA9LYC5_9GLOM|nr:15343_t:CDS:1 [Dentiscutata heterogama]
MGEIIFKNQTPETLSGELEVKRQKRKLKLKMESFKLPSDHIFKINQTPETFSTELKIKRIRPGNYQPNNYQHKFKLGIKRSNSLSNKSQQKTKFKNNQTPKTFFDRANSKHCRSLNSLEVMQQTIYQPQIVKETKLDSSTQTSGKNYADITLPSNCGVNAGIWDLQPKDFSRYRL